MQVVAVDLGMRATKAVHVARKGQGYELLKYAIQEAPLADKKPTAESFGEHLKGIAQSAGAKGKGVVLVAGVNDALLRQAELPSVPVSDMRMMLKYNSKNYLQQDLPDHLFDCSIIPPKTAPAAEGGKPPSKARVLVGAAKKSYVDFLQSAAKHAGLVIDQIALSLVGPTNALEFCHPEVFAKEVVAVVDIGFANSSIAILDKGELSLSRVVALGGDRLTSGLGEALGISYAEAEGIKVGMPEEVLSTMTPLLMPLGRELRALIDFFEHQQDRTVTEVYVCGGSARSKPLIDALQSELMVPCKSWSPLSFLGLSLPPEQLGEVENVAPQLAVAVGGAIASF